MIAELYHTLDNKKKLLLLSIKENLILTEP